MIVYYRFSGVLAVGGLDALRALHARALAGFDAVLTLPGLAGFVLSIGIAVDANVLIFERIREELDRGKTVRTAIDEGFQHAMSAIIDSNVSTDPHRRRALPVRHRPGERLRRHAHRRYRRVAHHLDLRRAHLLPPLAEPHARRPDAEHLMLRILHDTKYDFIKYWRTAVAATIAFIVLGVALMGYHKARTGEAINYSIEFTGGTVMQVHFAQPANAGCRPRGGGRGRVHRRRDRAVRRAERVS